VGPRGSRKTMESSTVDLRDDPHRGGIFSPCSSPAFFVTAAATHRAYTMLLPGGHGSMINLAQKGAKRDDANADDDAHRHLTRDYHQSPVQKARILM
jgi:hypothetical protein